MNASIVRTRYWRRWCAALLLTMTMLLVFPFTASAQTPEGIEGPWMDIFQLYWFTEPQYGKTPYNDPGYNANYGQLYRYGYERRGKCYYASEDGPDADKPNELYVMMNCREGLVIGLVTWSSVAIALMTFGWGGFMHVVDSAAGGQRLGTLRNMITGPLVGLLIVILAYPISKVIYGVLRYSFERYLRLDQFWY